MKSGKRKRVKMDDETFERCLDIFRKFVINYEKTMKDYPHPDEELNKMDEQFIQKIKNNIKEGEEMLKQRQ